MISYQDNLYIYDDIPSAGTKIRLLRVYGQSDTLVIPDMIDGKRVTVVGAYCFAPESKLTLQEEKACELFLKEHGLLGTHHLVAGDEISAVSLPDGVRCLESYAFYNCRNLKKLTFGAGLDEIHGDFMMNCRSLEMLVVRSDWRMATGIPYFLSQITSEIEVVFLPSGENGMEKEVRLLFPEYSESYEEIGPAHIFHLQVEGQGFRARKQFTNGILDLTGYDRVFENAVSTEPVSTLVRMAADRLGSPAELKPQFQKSYEAYLREHEREWLHAIVAKQDESRLAWMCESGLLTQAGREYAVGEAVKTGWLRGSAALLRTAGGDEDEYVF